MKTKLYRPFYLVALVVVAMLAAACSESPKKTAEAAADALLNGDWGKYYSMLSEEDKQLKSEDQVRAMIRKDDIQAEVIEVFPEVTTFLKNKKFKVESKNDTAKVTYVREILNLDQVFKGAFGFEEMMELGNKKVTSISSLPESLKEKVGAYIRSNDVPKEDREEKMMLIKEDGQWRVFKNFAFPERLKEAKATVKTYLKRFDYAGAKTFIHDFNTKYEVDELKDEQAMIDEWLGRITNLKHSITIGSLEFTPLAIEIKPVNFTGTTYSGDPTQTESALSYMVLQYRVKNVSKAQTFAPRNVPYAGSRPYTWVIDSSGNRMSVASTNSNPHGNIDPDSSKDLAPGQEIVYHAVVTTPVNEQADAYLWAVRLRVNNAADAFEDVFHLRFEKKDIPF